ITINIGRRCSTNIGEVTWPLPMVADNCAITSLSNNFNSGDIFPQGTSTVQYIAADGSGNTTICSFDVHIIRTIDMVDCQTSDCDLISMPTNSVQTQYMIPCGEEIIFTDTNGLNANYSDEVVNSNLVVLCPDMPSMQSIFIQFQTFDVATGDTLTAYDGNCTDTAIAITTPNSSGSGIGSSVADAPGGGWVQANCNNETGCIALEFNTNGDRVKGAGWSAAVSCQARAVEFACMLASSYYQIASCEAAVLNNNGELLTPFYAEVTLPVPSFNICGQAAPVLLDANCIALEVENFDTDGTLITCGDGKYVLSNATFVQVALPVGIHEISFTGLPLGYDCTALNIPENNYADKTCTTSVRVAQPPLACNDGVNVSLDQACSFMITPDLVLENTCENAPNTGISYTAELISANTPSIHKLPVLIGTTAEGYPIYDFSQVECGTYFDILVTRTIPNRACSEGETDVLSDQCTGRIQVIDRTRPALIGTHEVVEVPCYRDPGFVPATLDTLASDPYTLYSVVDNCSHR
ncbi:MAG: HYR domain-containing protein, partial [Bacteroidota bacterium]